MENKAVRLVFQEAQEKLEAAVTHGYIETVKLNPREYRLMIKEAPLTIGPPAAVVSLTGNTACSFFLRDVIPGRPIIAPVFGLAVTAAEDNRSYSELAAALPKTERTAGETNMDEAAASCSGMHAPVWLGLGGDSRIFKTAFCEDHGCWGWITPYRFDKPVKKADGYRVEWDFTVGRGSQYRHEITSRLEEGYLPVIHSKQIEPSVEYSITMFVTSDTGDMTENPPRGTHWQAAYMSTMGCMYTEEQKRRLKELYHREVVKREDLPVLCLRVTARNTGDLPAYAWYRMPEYKPDFLPPMYPPYAEMNNHLSLDPKTGFCLEDGNVFSYNTVNGTGLPNEELAVLVEPGEESVFECLLPFEPVSREKAEQLAAFDFDQLLSDCRDYWHKRLGRAHRWKLPEKGIDERFLAGIQHIIMNTLGEPYREDQPLLSTVGLYAPIGTESTPAIHHLDSVGMHGIAKRCLDYFYEIQGDNGYIQSFNYYDAETGPVLANTYRHFLITGDTAWIEKRLDNIKRACRYLIGRRHNHMAEQNPEDPGYGMLSGKTADPDEYFHQFILNALTEEGLRGAAEILHHMNDDYAEEAAEEAEALKAATLTGFRRAFAEAPLVPTAQGDWVPFISPWPGPRGEVSLYPERGRWFTHGSFHMRALAFLHLVCFGTVESSDRRMEALVRGLEHMVLLDYTGPSQPYGRRLDYYYIAEGQSRKFSQLYYRQLAKLQDRQLYTFWEHYYKLSSQKIHEEAWFLRQTAWMICFEEANGITLLKAVPEAWFAPGQTMEIQQIDTVYGPVSFSLKAYKENLIIRIQRSDGPILSPERFGIRIPGKIFGQADHGTYDKETGILEIDPGFQNVTVKVHKRVLC